MKKTLLITAIALVALSVSACSNKSAENSNEATNDQVQTTSNQTNNPADTTTSAPADTSAVSNSLSAASTTPVDNTSTMKTPDQQEDLLKQYSQAVIKTNYGDITVKFYGADSPITVNNFLNLAKSGFYNGVKFHRVIKDFMIQGGDPLSKESDTSLWGTGGPGYQFNDEFNSHKLVAGSLAMANAGANTNGSQFFIVTAAETPWLDGHHTNFGQVTAGMDVVKKIEAVETGANDRPVKDVVISGIELLK